jgi:hypothetical protein
LHPADLGFEHGATSFNKGANLRCNVSRHAGNQRDLFVSAPYARQLLDLLDR